MTTQAKHIETFNADQMNAYNELTKFMAGENGLMFCLKGYAGTGKTYLITKFISSFLEENRDSFIALSAPTNKAVAVLKEQADKALRKDRSVSFTTIHRILGVKPFITEDGKEIFVSEQEPEIAGLTILVIDEVSMLPDDLFEKLLPHADKVKIIFQGDPAQVPPVGKLDCEPFLNPEKYGIVTAELKQIMRQKEGSELVMASFAIRENLSGWHGSNMKGLSGTDLTVYESTSVEEKVALRAEIESVFASEAFLTAPDEFKFICWRNVRVRWYNDFVRSKYHGKPASELPQIVVNDLLITNNPVMHGEMIVLNNSQEVKVLSVLAESTTIQTARDNVYTVRCFDCDVEYFDVDVEQNVRVNIQILDERDEPKYKKILKTLADRAKEDPDGKSRRVKWVKFFEVKKRFADVNYSFALTTHKAQGSGFKRTFVDLADIQTNPNVVERNRIAYTALTRAKEHCLVIIN